MTIYDWHQGFNAIPELRCRAQGVEVWIVGRYMAKLGWFVRLRLGEEWQEHGLVFPDGDGRPYSPFKGRREFNRIRMRAGGLTPTFHSLRHTKGTFDKLAGVDMSEIAANQGHTSPAFTAKTYAHVVPESQRAATDRFEAFVRSSNLLSVAGLNDKKTTKRRDSPTLDP